MRIVVFLPLLILLALSMPITVFAEKGALPSNVKGNASQQVETAQKQLSHVDKSKKIKKAVENKRKSIDLPDQARKKNDAPTSNRGKLNNKELPEQASDKAKESVQKIVPKQQKKDNESDTPRKKQKKSESTNPKKEKTAERNASPKKEPVSDQNKTLPVSNQNKTTQPESNQKKTKLTVSEQNKISSPNKIGESDSNTETTEADTSDVPKDISAEDEIPKQESPIRFPHEQEWKLHIFQIQLSIKNPPVGLGTTNSKAKLDMWNGTEDPLNVTFEEPFVFRQHIFRNQWVNAPPTPPPKFALSFLSTV